MDEREAMTSGALNELERRVQAANIYFGYAVKQVLNKIRNDLCLVDEPVSLVRIVIEIVDHLREHIPGYDEKYNSWQEDLRELEAGKK